MLDVSLVVIFFSCNDCDIVDRNRRVTIRIPKRSTLEQLIKMEKLKDEMSQSLVRSPDIFSR